MSYGAPDRDRNHHGGPGDVFLRASEVQLDVGEVRGPDQRGEILGQAICMSLVALPRPSPSSPTRAMDRTILFVKERLIHAVRITLHRQGRSFRWGSRTGACECNNDHLALGEPGLGKDLLRFETASFFPSTDERALSGIGPIGHMDLCEELLRRQERLAVAHVRLHTAA
jgi:hypothetical protein